MNQSYLEVTYRHGKPLAAYYYLPRQEDDVSARVEKHGSGLLVDLTADGRAMGIEIIHPSLVTVDEINEILKKFGFASIAAIDLQPLQHAA